MEMPGSSPIRALVLAVLLLSPLAASWVISPVRQQHQRACVPKALQAKRPAKGGAPSSAKGFGGSSSSGPKLDLVRDKATLDFIEWLEKGGAQVQHLSIARLGSEKLRGMVALKVRRSSPASWRLEVVVMLMTDCCLLVRITSSPSRRVT